MVFIDKGRVRLNSSVEELLQKSFCVSGPAAEVERYCLGKNVIGCDVLGGMKIACIMGERSPLPEGGALQISPLTLQKLFVKLTDERSE